MKLDVAYKYCGLMKYKVISDEVESYISGYTHISTDRGVNCFVSHFEDKDGNRVVLTTSRDGILLFVHKNNFIERVRIDSNLFFTSNSLEKRSNGVIYTNVDKQFGISKRFNNEVVLTDLVENRYCVKRDKLDTLMSEVPEYSFDDFRFSPVLLKLRELDLSSKLVEESEYNNSFSSHMNTYIGNAYGRSYCDNNCSSHTYSNGKVISRLYDIVDGKDKIYRIYDLYNGIINPRNENDIYSMNLGLLTSDGFAYREYIGLRDIENDIVGSPEEKDEEEYVSYLKKYFQSKIGYKGEVRTDREGLLECINYQLSAIERVKKTLEQKLGIPYEEFESLDFDEQERLIEEKTGKKITYDTRLYIDGIPMDEEHIIRMEDVDKRIDKMLYRGPKGLIRRLKNVFKKN